MISGLLAIELKPEFTEAHSNFGNLLKEMGRLQDAEAAYRRALELKPDHTDTKLNLGILLLTLGRYGEGWPNYNAGHTPDTKARRDMRPPFSFPEWQGEALAGKSLVVVIEQGAGDNVQFVRYAPLLKAHGLTRLSYFQPGAFIPLLATAHGVKAAMIYDKWFASAVGPDWVRLATLSVTRPKGAIGDWKVAIYATDAANAAALRDRLVAFAPTLPGEAVLTLEGGGA